MPPRHRETHPRLSSAACGSSDNFRSVECDSISRSSVAEKLLRLPVPRRGHAERDSDVSNRGRPTALRAAEGYHSRGPVFTRRQFLASLAMPLTLGQSSTRGRVTHPAPTGFAVPRTPDGYPPLPAVDAAAIGRELRRQFSDLRNHFIFGTTRGTARTPGDTGKVPVVRLPTTLRPRPFPILGPMIRGIRACSSSMPAGSPRAAPAPST